MNRKNKWIIYGIGLSLLLGGCMNMDNEKKNVDSKEATGPYKDTFVRVQDYTGEGYVLRNGEDADKIAEEKSDEVQKAAKDFFMEKYKTDVKVHNIVGNVDGATVFVESTGPVHFYTTAIVPIDLSQKKVMKNEVVSLEGEVESAIRGGLYHLMFEKEFAELDQYLEKIVAENKVVGKTREAIEKVGGTGYMTPYYFITTSSSDEAIKPVFDEYIKNPNTPPSKLKTLFDVDKFSVENLKINLQLFMEEEDVEPSKELFNQIPKDLREMNSIPKGSYSLIINDNLINEKVDDGYKENSLRIGVPDYIVIK
ncbi:uncharacterized protein DUF1672 [Bacillus sp. V-88]|uniref:DUF1672 family protein n=1 Tax=Rossellomorea vietnamensis TaxID=218284 RepID=UPI000555F66E|nr:DUF1672 family protein [Rossellomorea vietnamensis]OXS53912.1 hypothetical protein B1B00_21345 [Bacillus sp. DSM 27956]PRX64058.1 uncharacterized protein DUF1672 [Bacillus sp. V-88]SLK25069.1 Protein of unknown function [Bacillus sp. V-88]